MQKALLVASLMLFAACGGGSDSATNGSSGGGAEGGLTPAQIERGIGPVEEVALDAVDQTLAEQGADIFKTKCSACHKMDTRYVGPPLGDVLEARTPEYVMNMMLNPEEMLKKHPTAKALLAEYMTPMPDQQLTKQDARAVLEYLRTVESSE